MQQGGCVQNDFADGNEPVSWPNSLQGEAGKTYRVLLGKVFKALTPGGWFVIHGAGAVPAFDGVTPQQPATSGSHVLLSFPRGMRIR